MNIYTCLLPVYCMLLVFNVSQFIKQINIGICDCWYKKFFRDINLSQTNTYVLVNKCANTLTMQIYRRFHIGFKEDVCV